MQTISEEKREQYLASMGQNLRMLRSRAGLTQRQASDLIGISLQTYVNAEKRGQLSWNTYLALLFLFEREFAAEPEILEMMKNLQVYPREFEKDILPADREPEEWKRNGQEKW